MVLRYRDRGKGGVFPLHSVSARTLSADHQPGLAISSGPYLSSVVLADIIALTADRWLNVTPYPESRKMRVAVFGVGYEDSSSHKEANESLSLSLFNTLTGTVESETPAAVSGSSIVEVRMEQLDPQWGEDFGWPHYGRRSFTARARPAGRTTPHSVWVDPTLGSVDSDFEDHPGDSPHGGFIIFLLLQLIALIALAYRACHS